MTVGDLKSRLSVFHHITDSDKVLIAYRDPSTGTVRYLNLYDTIKISVDGRQLPVLAPGDVTYIPDTINGRYRIISMQGETKWSCINCGELVDELDKFCKHCGSQLSNKTKERGGSNGEIAETSGLSED